MRFSVPQAAIGAQVNDVSGPRKSHPPAPDVRSRRTIRTVFAAALVILALWMVRSYVVALAWAVVIIIGIWPLYQRFAPRPPARRKWFAPLAATVLTAVVLVITVFLSLAENGREGEAVLRWIGDAQKS